MKQSWDISIARAKELALKRSEMTELLTFYAKLLSAQKQIYEHLRSRKGWLPSGLLAQDLDALRLMLPTLLEVIEAAGPAALADEARHLAQATEREINEMLSEYWRAPADVE